MNVILERLRDLFFSDELYQRLLQKFLPDLVVGIVSFAVIWLLWRAFDRAMVLGFTKSELDKTAQSFVRTLLRYAMMSVAVLTALGQMGVNVGSIIAGLGIAGLTIGFAAKDAMSNIISGLFIFWDRPFVIGDLIEIGSDYGEVKEITMRSTRVVTVDGRMLAIPNTTILNSIVASYTNFPNLRLDIDFTIGVNEDIDRVRVTALSVLEGDQRCMTEPPPRVVVMALNDYNNALQLRVWIKDEREHQKARFALRERLFKALMAAGVDMPLETLALAPIQVQNEPSA